MGGSDQWGNIVTGIDLGRRMGTSQLYALTTPLITTSSGAKMGKTAQGAIWLNAEMLSPYDYWQFWRNTEDGDVARFLKLFTTLPMTEIARLERLSGSEINEAKKVLASEATALLHGREAAERSGADSSGRHSKPVKSQAGCRRFQGRSRTAEPAFWRRSSRLASPVLTAKRAGMFKVAPSVSMTPRSPMIG